MLVRRNAFERVGRFTEDIMVDFVEWYARANVLGLRTRLLTEVVAMRRHHPANTGRRLRSRQQDDTLLALKRSLDMRRRSSS